MIKYKLNTVGLPSHQQSLTASQCEDVEINNCLDKIHGILQKNNLNNSFGSSTRSKSPGSRLAQSDQKRARLYYNTHSDAHMTSSPQVSNFKRKQVQFDEKSLEKRKMINPEELRSVNAGTNPGSSRIIEQYEKKLNRYEDDFKLVVNENCDLKIKIEQLSQLNKIQSAMMEDQKAYYEQLIKNMEQSYQQEIRYLKLTNKNQDDIRIQGQTIQRPQHKNSDNYKYHQ